jgi:signal transduction histidine kinase
VGGGGLWPVEVDAAELESVLVNLVVNARDAMPKGGKLTVEASNSYLDDAYCSRHSDVQPGQYVLISVTDNGLGMTEDVVQHAFEPFYTTKQAGQGTGLGLSQVYGFVRQSGGHVKIYSEVAAPIPWPSDRRRSAHRAFRPRSDRRMHPRCRG